MIADEEDEEVETKIGCLRGKLVLAGDLMTQDLNMVSSSHLESSAQPS